jgi:hypothetical protein
VSEQVIGVPGILPGILEAELPCLLHRFYEAFEMLRENVRIQAPESDAKEAALSEEPSVADEVAAEIEFRQFAIDGAGLKFGGSHLKLNFARHYRLRFVVIAEMASDWTEVSAGPDEHIGMDLIVDDPAVAVAHDGVDGEVFTNASAGAAKQVVVELAATDAIADGLATVEHDIVFAENAGTKAGYILEGAVASVILEVKAECADDLRSDPAAAKLIARKCGAIDDEHVET